jgi:23S rRNA (adenine2030-N6)-methyltransferase
MFIFVYTKISLYSLVIYNSRKLTTINTMLSYRHAFHAGNHADVLKHFVLSAVLHYFNQKDKPYWVVDTHAGAGMYALNSEYANKNAEYADGINRLIHLHDPSDAMSQYFSCIQSFNANNEINFYPGSPKIVEYFLRKDDKLRLFELHPSDYKILAENFDNNNSRQIKMEMKDGFNGIKACLPPPTKRGIVLIDPPYEVKEDYEHVITCIKDSLKRFATGTYMIWYPLLQRPEPLTMINRLAGLNLTDWLNVKLKVQDPSNDGYGMHGSGMFIINPPWNLPATLNKNMPLIASILALDESASFNIESHIT